MKKISFEITLPVSILREGKRFVAYTPALDISTSGRTQYEAKKHFAELAQIFLEELAEMGTLDTVLENLGWKKNPQKKWLPPVFVSHELTTVKV